MDRLATRNIAIWRRIAISRNAALDASAGILASSNMQPSDPRGEQLRHLVHELAEALTATNSYLQGSQHLEGSSDLHAAIGKAIEQVNRAGEVVAQLRLIAGSMELA